MPNRITGQVSRKMGVEGTAQEASEALATRAGKEAGPLYREAENQGAVWNERIQEMLQDPIMQRGLAQGQKLQRLEALGTGQPAKMTDPAITSFNAAGDPVVTGVPNMKTLQSVKVGLDHMIEAQTDAVRCRCVTPSGSASISRLTAGRQTTSAATRQCGRPSRPAPA
jgi:hypothetical protein